MPILSAPREYVSHLTAAAYYIPGTRPESVSKRIKKFCDGVYATGWTSALKLAYKKLGFQDFAINTHVGRSERLH
jgi:hypothetical protein